MEKIERSSYKKSEVPTFVEILHEYVRHCKWFILAIIISLTVGLAAILTTQKVYRSSISILLNEDKTPRPKTAEINLEDLGLLSTTNNIDNEIAILSSPDLMTKVVDSLNLQSSYYIEDKLRRKEIFSNTPFHISCKNGTETFEGDITIEKEQDNFRITGKYSLKGNKMSINETVSNLPIDIVLSDSSAILAIQSTGEDVVESQKYYITIRSVISEVNYLCSKLSIIPTSRNSSVLNISILVNDEEKGAAILRELVRRYNEQNIEVNNEMSHNTAKFINERLSEISAELGDAEENIVDFKQRNKITDLNSEAELFVKQTGQNDDRLLEIETQLNILSMVERFVNDPANKFKLVPDLGISDSGLSRIVSEYNNKLLNSESLLKNMGAENPSRMRLIGEIENIHASISNSLLNVKQGYNVSKRDFLKQSYSTQSRIQSIPEQEKGLIGIIRKQKIKENLVVFLMQKREETDLSIASTADKARIIVSPQKTLLPIAPKSKIILLSAIAIGLIIPILVIYLINLFRTQINGRYELEKLTHISIIGQICKNDNKLQNTVANQLDSQIAEMFRSLRNNISFIFKNDNHKIVLVTSTIPGEGKTFISINLALSFALSGKKVLLVGMDVRSPKFKDYMTSVSKKGLTDFLVENDNNWKNYVNQTEVNPNLYVMSSGTIPPNPNEILITPKLGTFLLGAKQDYDMVILDTTPVGLVSDTYLVNSSTDITLYIVRQNVTPKAAVNFINTQKEENRFNNMYLVLNESSLDTDYKYGYGKTYGY